MKSLGLNLQVVSFIGTALYPQDANAVRWQTGDWQCYFYSTRPSRLLLNLPPEVGPNIGSVARSISANFPIVTEFERAQFQGEFERLASQWHRETKMLSSIPQIVLHPAYQRIIAMGPAAIPFILEDLKKTRGHWLWALNVITGQDQAKPGQTFREAVDSWLRWGEEQNPDVHPRG